MEYWTFKYPLPSSIRFADFAVGLCGQWRLLCFDKKNLSNTAEDPVSLPLAPCSCCYSCLSLTGGKQYPEFGFTRLCFYTMTVYIAISNIKLYSIIVHVSQLYINILLCINTIMNYMNIKSIILQYFWTIMLLIFNPIFVGTVSLYKYTTTYLSFFLSVFWLTVYSPFLLQIMLPMINFHLHISLSHVWEFLVLRYLSRNKVTGWRRYISSIFFDFAKIL